MNIVYGISFLVSADKFDNLKFLSEYYISSCGPNIKCRICFDLVKTKKFTISELNWKTHISDSETKTKDYSSKVQNIQLLRRQIKEIKQTTGYNYANTEQRYTCNYNLNLTGNIARCYETYIQPINYTNATRIHFEKEYKRISGKTIFWNVSEIISEINEKINITTEDKITSADILSLFTAQIGTTYTVCLEGNVKSGEKVDIYPEIFGYNYTEYAIWKGNKVSLLFSNWSEWNITRFNSTIWLPYTHVIGDNLTLDYVYLNQWNFTHINGTDI